MVILEELDWVVGAHAVYKLALDRPPVMHIDLYKKPLLFAGVTAEKGHELHGVFSVDRPCKHGPIRVLGGLDKLQSGRGLQGWPTHVEAHNSWVFQELVRIGDRGADMLLPLNHHHHRQRKLSKLTTIGNPGRYFSHNCGSPEEIFSAQFFAHVFGGQQWYIPAHT